MMAGATDRDFLDHLLVLIEDPDDGWIETVDDEGYVVLVHTHSQNLRLRVHRGRVALLIRARARDAAGTVAWQTWKPGGLFGWWHRRRLNKAVVRLQRYLVMAPIQEALNGDLHEEPPPADEDTDDDFLDFDEDSDEFVLSSDLS